MAFLTALVALLLGILFVVAAIVLHSVTPSLAVFRRVWALRVPNKAFRIHWWRPVLGDISRFQDFTAFMAETSRIIQKQGVWLFWAAFEPHVILADTADIRAVLTRPAADQNTSNRRATKLTYRFFGKGILQASGEDWRQQHRVMYKAFASHNLGSFRPAYAARADKFIDQMLSQQDKVDSRTELANLTLGVMVDTNFGNTLSPDEQALFATTIDQFLSEARNPWHQLPWLNYVFAKPKLVDDCFRTMYMLVETAIQRRRQGKVMDAAGTSNTVSKPAIDLLLEAGQEVEGDYVMDDTTLRDNLLTLISAGTETTATTMSWVLAYLDSYPEVYAKVMEENATVVLDDLLDQVDLSLKVPYLTQVIKETLRMRPPVFVVPSRRLFRDTTLPSGIQVPSGLSTGIFTSVIHQDPKLWHEPEVFRPERFAHGGEAQEDRFKFLAFGTGSRFCLGKYMAMAEMQVVLSKVLRKVRFEAATPAQGLEPVLRSFVVVPKHSMMRAYAL
eukprot:m.160546 g.160546  ORF g.160546 m.160546 type:complete len:502 (-) comp16504_c0_seq3:1208-2713(-)